MLRRDHAQDPLLCLLRSASSYLLVCCRSWEQAARSRASHTARRNGLRSALLSNGQDPDPTYDGDDEISCSNTAQEDAHDVPEQARAVTEMRDPRGTMNSVEEEKPWEYWLFEAGVTGMITALEQGTPYMYYQGERLRKASACAPHQAERSACPGNPSPLLPFQAEKGQSTREDTPTRPHHRKSSRC